MVSPFEIIGPPREIDGVPAIYPLQVRGPDEEIVYLTQIRADLPAVAAWDAIRSVVAPEEEEPTLHAVAEAATTSSTKTTR